MAVRRKRRIYSREWDDDDDLGPVVQSVVSLSYSHFFSKKFQNICVSLDVNFKESLTNDVVSFEQLGPGVLTSLSTLFVILR